MKCQRILKDSAASVHTVGFPPCGGGLHILLTLPFSPPSPKTAPHRSCTARCPKMKESWQGSVFRCKLPNSIFSDSKCKAESTTQRVHPENVFEPPRNGLAHRWKPASAAAAMTNTTGGEEEEEERKARREGKGVPPSAAGGK